MKIYLYIALLFLIQLGFSQNNKIRGYVQSNGGGLENVSVQNTNTNDLQITNNNGYFEITAKKGDVLRFSLMGFENQNFTVLEKDLSTTNFIIQMKIKVQELSPVVINKQTGFDALSLGIISKKPKTLTINERRLKTAGDFKPIHLLGLLTGNLPLDPIINKINGKTATLKKNIAVEKKEKNIQILKNNYQQYITDILKIENEFINAFVYFVAENIQEDLSNKNSNQIMFLLSNHKSMFLERQQQK
jgi:hypothetical protein